MCVCVSARACVYLQAVIVCPGAIKIRLTFHYPAYTLSQLWQEVTIQNIFLINAALNSSFARTFLTYVNSSL